MVRKNMDGPFLRKTVFFILWGPFNFFWTPKTLFGLRNPTFGGVIILTFFDPSNGLRVGNYHFLKIQTYKSLKLLLRSKNVRSMTPPKVGFLRPNKVLGVQKKLRGPHKMKKINFLKKGYSYNLPKT